MWYVRDPVFIRVIEWSLLCFDFYISFVMRNLHLTLWDCGCVILELALIYLAKVYVHSHKHPFPSNIYITFKLPYSLSQRAGSVVVFLGPPHCSLISKLCLTHASLCEEDDMYMYERIRVQERSKQAGEVDKWGRGIEQGGERAGHYARKEWSWSITIDLVGK